MQIKREEVNKKFVDNIYQYIENPLCTEHHNIIRTMIRKSIIRVTKTGSTPPSNCQLIIKGIKPHQQVDLCKSCCINLTKVDAIDSQSIPAVNSGPVSVTSGKLPINKSYSYIPKNSYNSKYSS